MSTTLERGIVWVVLIGLVYPIASWFGWESVAFSMRVMGMIAIFLIFIGTVRLLKKRRGQMAYLFREPDGSAHRHLQMPSLEEMGGGEKSERFLELVLWGGKKLRGRVLYWLDHSPNDDLMQDGNWIVTGCSPEVILRDTCSLYALSFPDESSWEAALRLLNGDTNNIRVLVERGLKYPELEVEKNELESQLEVVKKERDTFRHRLADIRAFIALKTGRKSPREITILEDINNVLPS